MSNPFDQFDQADANPFDAFDAPKKPGLMQQATGFMANVNRGLGVGDEIAGGVQALVNGLSGRGFSPTAAMQQQRATEDGYARTNPTMAALGRGTGMAATAVVPGAPLLQGTRAMSMARGAVTAGATGAAYAAADRGTAGERLKSASQTAMNPVVLGLGAGAGALARTTPRAPKPANSEAARLTQRGVPTTLGDRQGPAWQRLEDGLESLPMTGAAIKARKAESIAGFDKVAINEALAPIGATVKGSGRKAVGEMNQAVSKAYEGAVDGVQLAPDTQHAADLAAAAANPKTPAHIRKQVQDFVDEFVLGPLTADPSARTWKDIDAEIGKAVRKADASTEAGSGSLKRALKRVEDAHWGLIERQRPDVAEKLDLADQANAAAERIRNAAGKAGTASRDGLFTAGDLNSAVAGSGRSNRRAYGQGTALMQGLTDDAMAVLPSTVPDSGTALRSILTRIGLGGGALAGVGAVGGAGVAVPAAIGAGLADTAGAALYSKSVQDALRRSYLARQSGAPAGLLSPRVSARLARVGGLLGTPQSAPRN